MIRRDEGVAVGGCFAEPRAKDQQQVRIANPLGNLGVGAVAKVPRIGWASVVDGILAPERGDQRDAVSLTERGGLPCRFAVPIGSTDDRNRRTRAGDGGSLYRRLRRREHPLL